MNEQEPRQDQELEPVQPEIDESDPKTIKGSKRQNSRLILWTVCALYLLYLSFNLIQGLVAGNVEGSSKTVSIIGAVVFIAVAGFLLFSAIRTGLRSFKESVQSMVDADEAEERAEAQRRELEAAEDDDQLELEEEDDNRLESGEDSKE